MSFLIEPLKVGRNGDGQDETKDKKPPPWGGTGDMELVDMALYGASRVADIKKDISALREMLEASRSAS